MDISLPLSTASAERFDSLFQYYSRKYELEQLSLKLAGREFKIYHIRDIDPLLEELIGLGPESPEMRDERLPYWAELWPAAIGLSQFILENSVLCGNQTAIELGCGVGLAGIAAASLGAEVMISDYQKDALALAELNWIINIGRSPQAIRMDWRNLTIQEKFDNVIASDIVYEERFFHPIINNFSVLCKPAGRVILSEPNRRIATPFFNSLIENGWEFQKTDVSVQLSNRDYLISVYVIKRKGD